MNEETRKIRHRLAELHELRVTGFVNDEQYGESKTFLERKLVDAVMRDEAADVPTSPHLVGDTPAPSLPEVMVAAPAQAPASGRRWLVGTMIAAILAVAGYWWAGASRGPADETMALGNPSAAAPVSDAAASTTAAALAPTSEPAPTAATVIDAAPVAAPMATASAGSISGTVSLAAALARQVKPTDTVFVYAHAVDGPPMPLAVIRKQVMDLPLVFTLDDSMATWPSAKVSAFPRVVVTARVSKSGEGKARAGDLQGESAPVSAGTAGLQIEIGAVVGK